MCNVKQQQLMLKYKHTSTRNMYKYIYCLIAQLYMRVSFIANMLELNIPSYKNVIGKAFIDFKDKYDLCTLARLD